jgi:hypothetical protein
MCVESTVIDTVCERAGNTVDTVHKGQGRGVLTRLKGAHGGAVEERHQQGHGSSVHGCVRLLAVASCQVRLTELICMM